ncbi:putative endonuclease [Propionispira arboris]|uniref:Putative endonuclease n=1 Tax=Propionispira arboris TaxID=84035 RepID=A0A1H6X535_9FIRM|nr:MULTISPECIES: GIY-YIG nuclease family protein [Propionispira]SEJ22604.1 putative endonuclease [Propionispira arboris]
MDAFTYILECADGTFYTGWTSDLEKRLANHNSKKGAKYTRCRIPVKLVYFESFITKQEAQKREYAIKQLKRDQKLQLINSFVPKPL